MKKGRKILGLGLIFFVFLAVGKMAGVGADESCSGDCSSVEDCMAKIEKCQEVLEMSIAATKPHEEAIIKMEKDVEAMEANIETIEEELVRKEAEIVKESRRLAGQEEILAEAVREFYKKNKAFGNFGYQLLSGKSLGEVARVLFYQQMVVDDQKEIIVEIVLAIKGLENKKEELAKNKEWLAAKKVELEGKMEPIRELVKGAKDYQENLAGKIASLTATQEKFLAEKLASLNLPRSATAIYCTDDRNIDPGFSPAFAFFTFGIPHRVGMNQYGAYGRAKAGQGYQDILRTYYEGVNVEKRDPGMRIKVQGFGEMGIEEYLLGVYEMPSSWPIEALKAQAVAARSYAIAYTNNGEKEICTTQACQVYKGGNKGGEWERAVRETEGEVLISGGEVISAWYASTYGGYTFTSADVGWSYKPWTKRMRDTEGEVGSFEDLFNKAYDRESPCFYAAQGWRSEYNKSAWLKQEEVADIVNVLLLAKADPGTQKHLVQVDKENPDGVETWDANKVKEELGKRGVGAYNSISGISIDWDKGGGITTSVTVSGDGGSRSFGGSEFKDYFNLRAPANIQIVGPLYNVERK